MTTDLQTPSTAAPTAAAHPGRSAGSLLLPIAGGALIAGSLLYASGMLTSPPADSMAEGDYIASLARDEGRTALSAILLHYGNLAIGLAWLAAPALVRGLRGRVPTIVGALMSALGMTTVAGLVLSDFWTGAVGRLLDADTALAVFLESQTSAGMTAVSTVMLLGLLGPIVGFAGLARAGVISWWLLVPVAVALVGSAALPFSPAGHGTLALLGAVPTVVVGLRLLQRNRAERAAA